ncbi:MAG: hypothetical protein ACREHD_07910 [Pirellulales bacterium]
MQSAAQQATGGQSTVLGNLASQFQNVANTGDLSQLQTHHHHGHHAGGGTYGGNGQPTSTGSTSSSGSGSLQQTLSQLFTNFTDEVESALGDQSAASTATGS